MGSGFQNGLSATVRLFLVLFLVLVYRAYVVIQPCRHDIKPLNEARKLKLGDEQVKRLQTALTIETVSFSKTHQNQTELHRYINFIRKGLIFMKFMKL
jgi:hypothetical protein